MRKLATFCAAFACGVFASQYFLPARIQLFAACGLAAIFLLLAALLRGKLRLRLLLITAGLAVSLGWNWLYTTQVQAPFEALAGKTETLTLELADYAEPSQYGARAQVRILGRGLHGKAIYYGSEDLLTLEPGQRISVHCYVSSSAKVRDSEITTFTSRGVFALLYRRGGEETLLEQSGAALRFLPQRLARRLQGAIADVFPQQTQPFLRAILLGDRSGLSEEDETYLSEAGLMHITAVSGLHCAFLVSLLGFFIGRHRAKLFSGVALPVLALYALCVGATPSVVRACIMLGMALLAPIFERENDGATSLSLALLLILVWNPFAAASISLQLSFGAMAGLLWLTPGLYEKIRAKKRSRWQSVLLGSFAATAGAMVFTVPLTAYYFNLLVLIAPLSNLLALWAASLVFALGFPATALGVFLALPARILACLPHLGALYLLKLARLLASIPYHAVYFSNRFLRLWLIYAYALFIACRILRRGKRRYVFAGALAAAALALTVWLNTLPLTHGALHVIALDVGQGQSLVLHSKGHTALVDCGSSNSFLSAGDIAADYLQSIGCRHIDYIMLTHYHSDHCNGLPVLLARLRADTLILPDIEPQDELRAQVLELAERYQIPVTFVRAEHRFPLGEAELTVYPPLTEGEMNEEGISALCTAGEFDLLVTGDMDANTEYLLIAQHTLPDIETLIVGHHGSRDSTGEDLLAEVRPESGIVSCGSNSYGHPHAAALRRLDHAGVTVYRTDLQGDIHITVN